MGVSDSPSPTHYKAQGAHGGLFWLPTSGTAMGTVCLLASKWPFTFCPTTPTYPTLSQLKMISPFQGAKTAEISPELMKNKCHSILL